MKSCCRHIRLRLPVAACLVWIVAVGGALRLSEARAETVDRIAAVVNEDIVLLSELEQAMAAFQRKMSQEGVPETEQQQILRDRRKAVLNQLINEKLTAQQVTRLGLKVDEAEIDATIQKIKQVNKLSDTALQQMLDLEGLSMADYRERVKEQLLQNRLVNQEVRSKIVVTEADVKAYYEARQTQFSGPAQYHLRQILLKVDRAAGQQERRSVLEKIRAVRERLVAGEKFAELAAIYSQSSTAANGGDLGIFEARLLAPQILEALEGRQAGEFTDIVETEQGYQILFVEELVRDTRKSLAEATPEIQEKLFAEIIEQKFQLWLKQLRDKAHIKIIE
jgi:peptidyl-prolyl cis-trans isomerase SurA